MIPVAPEAAAACSGLSDNHIATSGALLSSHRSKSSSASVRGLQRHGAILHTPSDNRELHKEGSDQADASDSTVGLLSLSKDVRWPPLLPQQNELCSSFWQADGSFSCDWEALRTGEAFCSSVNACCVSCLSRALGGPSEMTSALLEKLRAGAKTAIKEEIDHLIQTVKASAASGAGQDGVAHSQGSDDLTQQLLKHPALQAVAFLSVHERRLAVFEMWLDRWQVLSRGYECTCGSAEATSAGLSRIVSGADSTSAETKTTVEDLRAQVAQLREEARRAHQEEESVVAEARALSIELMKKQRDLLLATERVKALEKVRKDPCFGIFERAQQQLPLASSASRISTYKESLRFIADKCNKLANLTQLIQQQFPHPQTTGLPRPSWEASQVVATAADAPEGPADASTLGALRELQTPHVSMHSPHSLRARCSSHLASPVMQTENLDAAPRHRRLRTSDDDARSKEQKNAQADGRRTRSPLRPGNLRVMGEAPVSSARAVIPPLSSPARSHRNDPPLETGNNKRTLEPEDTALRGRWRRALNPAIRHAELDMDAEAAWQPVESTTRGDPMQTKPREATEDGGVGYTAEQVHASKRNNCCFPEAPSLPGTLMSFDPFPQEAFWVDSFLRRRPEAS